MIGKKKRTEIAKRLAAISFVVTNWDNEHWGDYTQCVLENAAEIAFSCGGLNMMSQVQLLVYDLYEKNGVVNPTIAIFREKNKNVVENLCKSCGIEHIPHIKKVY